MIPDPTEELWARFVVASAAMPPTPENDYYQELRLVPTGFGQLWQGDPIFEFDKHSQGAYAIGKLHGGTGSIDIPPQATVFARACTLYAELEEYRPDEGHIPWLHITASGSGHLDGDHPISHFASLDDLVTKLEAIKAARPQQTWPALFEMEPIGVDGALEATATHRFCSTDCRKQFKASAAAPAEPTKDGEDDGAIPDERCTAGCGTILLNPSCGEQ